MYKVFHMTHRRATVIHKRGKHSTTKHATNPRQPISNDTFSLQIMDTRQRRATNPLFRVLRQRTKCEIYIFIHRSLEPVHTLHRSPKNFETLERTSKSDESPFRMCKFPWNSTISMFLLTIVKAEESYEKENRMNSLTHTITWPRFIASIDALD